MGIGNQVLGVIATYHRTDDYVYDEDDLEVLQTIASQAAIALRNTRLVQELAQNIKELEALQDLAIDFSAGALLVQDHRS